MSAHPFSSELKDGILQLWLDTPRCDVNVFSAQAAQQLETMLREADHERVRAVVFRSAKPGSFLNGAQLMLANSVQHTEDVARLTEPVRNAYRAVRALRVPTIAAVQGACYGCGVEFVLQADYRVAERAVDTHFYLTEIADYLLIPVFGASQDLPRLVGLENATKLLLWGERWTADQALECGLVDAVFDQSEFDARLAELVATATKGVCRPRPPPHGDLAAFVARTLARIEELPPDYRPVYSRCFELLVAAANHGADYEREVAACAETVARHTAKAAVPFFFIRELAKAKCRRGAPDRRQVHVTLRGLPELERHIQIGRPRDVTLDPAAADASALRLSRYSEAAAEPSGGVAAALEPVLAEVCWTTELIAYAPLYAHGIHFFEIAERPPSGRSAEVFDLLSRLGFCAISTRPQTRFAADELLEAYFAPLRAFVQSGGTKEIAAATLREFGFIRGPGELAGWLGPDFAPELAGARPLGGSHRGLLDALLVSLLDYALRSRETGSVTHPSLIDLMARELLDFPLAHTSLSRHLTRHHAATILERAGDFEAWVGPRALERARRYACGSRDFYA